MTASTANLFTRDDTLLGICQGLGEEFGFRPNYLRIVLAASLLWNPAVMIGCYLAMGVVLMLTRWLMPVRKTAAAAAPVAAAQNDEALPPLAQAA